jgi:serine/threonine protein kinase
MLAHSAAWYVDCQRVPCPSVASEELEPGDWATERAGNDLRPHRVVEGEAEWTRGYERDEHVARTVRLRKILIWGGLAWLSFLPTDLSFNVMRGDEYGGTFVLARLLALVPLLLLWWRLGRTPAFGPITLAVLEAGVISIIAGTTAFMAVLSGGLASPIVAGLLPILVVRALVIPEPWQRGVSVALAPALAFWGVLGVGTWLSPTLVLPDQATGANLVLQLGMQVVTIAMIVAASNISWDVRRNLYRARVVGRYELLRPLGRGAMGEVWVAWHQSLRQQVALKILPVDHSAAVARFEREVAATTKLRHPNTVRVYDFGHTHDGFWFYAMELLEGETLTELVVREGPLPVARALSLLRQAARALAEAHSHGIVHRDIKPDNLFVSAPAGERDVIKVLDFGVASTAVVPAPGPTEPLNLQPDQTDREPPTEPGTQACTDHPSESEQIVGTPLYISPEVARRGKAGPRSDIYALGCVLYFMLTGRPVFVERDVSALLRAHAKTPPTPPSTLLAEPLPEYVEKMVLRCLAKDPEQRYENADALVAAIDLCLRLGDIDRRRGAGESQLPRTRVGLSEVEAWAKHARTETDMSLIGTEAD